MQLHYKTLSFENKTPN